MNCAACGAAIGEGLLECPGCGKAITLSRLTPRSLKRPPLPGGGALGGRYEIRAILGEGPLATVYRALDREIDVEVAVKVLRKSLFTRDEDREAFVTGCAEARRLSHPNLVRVFHADAKGVYPFFSMQLVEGTTLRKLIEGRRQKSAPIPLEEVEPVLSQVAAALGQVYAAMPGHGLLKPENVLILPDLVKITDFHLASSLPLPALLVAEARGGAPVYLAPEFRAGAPLTPAADVYSLGVILVELLTGAPPTGSHFRLASVRPDLPPRLDRLIGTCLSDDPRARLGSPSEVARELLKVLAERAVTGSGVRPAPASVTTTQPTFPGSPTPTDPGFAARPAATSPPAATPVGTLSTLPGVAPRQPPPLPASPAQPDLRPRASPPPLPSEPAAAAPSAAPVVPPPAETRSPTETPARAVPAVPAPARRPVPVLVWIALILAVVGGGTWGVIRYLEKLRAEDRAALLRQTEEERGRLREERLRLEKLRADLESKEREAEKAAAEARQRAEMAARAAGADPERKAEAKRLAEEAQKKEALRKALRRKRREVERRQRQEAEREREMERRLAAGPAPAVAAPAPKPPEPEPKEPVLLAETPRIERAADVPVTPDPGPSAPSGVRGVSEARAVLEAPTPAPAPAAEPPQPATPAPSPSRAEADSSAGQPPPGWPPPTAAPASAPAAVPAPAPEPAPSDPRAADTAATEAPKTIFLRDGMARPERISGRDPSYVPQAKSAGISGTVVLLFTITPEGAVRSVRILKDLPILGEACVAAVRQWKFRPPVVNGKPVSMVVKQAFVFRDEE
jgi:TonB family protein